MTEITVPMMRAALDRAAENYKAATGKRYLEVIAARLRVDEGGKVIAALNKLKAAEFTYRVMFATIEAAHLATHQKPIRNRLLGAAAQYRTEAAKLRGVLERIQEKKMMFRDDHAAAVEAAAGFLSARAIEFQAMPKVAGLSQKPDVAMAILRRLRGRLWTETAPIGRPVMYEPLRLLAEAALGIEIDPKTVTDALRTPRKRTGGDTGKAKSKKSPLRKTRAIN